LPGTLGYRPPSAFSVDKSTIGKAYRERRCHVSS
jgi:hypothetical protein